MQRQWQNWSKHLSATPLQWLQPQSCEELSRIVIEHSGPMRVLGSGHSFTPLAQTNGTMLDLSAFSGMKAYDVSALTATFGAATPIGQAAQCLKDAGLALPNMGDIDKQAFAGALATGTHGSGCTLGAYHTLLTHLELVDGRGKQHTFKTGPDDEMLKALGVHLGAFGALTAFTFAVQADYRLNRRRYKMALNDVLADFEALMSAHRSAEFYIIPHWDHVAFLATNLTDQPATIRPPDEDEEAVAALKKLRDWLKTWPWLRRKVLGIALSRYENEDYVEDWLKVYPTERNTRFNEMEYHLPIEHAGAALRDILAVINRSPDVYFPIEVRTVTADAVWLSPFYQRPTCSIAVHHGADENMMPYFNAVEPIFKKYHGRPHWGKMHSLKAPELSRLYPKWKEAMDLRREFDPDNKFVTPYMADLFGLNHA